MGVVHSDGAAAANLDLSRRRASSVLRYLTRKGTAPDRLAAEGYGATRPIAPNTTPDDRAENRRVEFTILELAPE